MYRNGRRNIAEIARIMADITDRKLIEDFLGCLLTQNELREVDGRWQLVKLLDQGLSQRKIAQQLSMSLCKITRGSRELKKSNSAFKRVLQKYL